MALDSLIREVVIVSIIGVRTGLISTVAPSGTPKTTTVWQCDAGTGVQESSEQVPIGVAATLTLGRATTGVKTAQRLLNQAINSRANVAT